MSTITLHEFRFVPADADHMKTGLMGWVSFALNNALRIEGVTLRRTAGGRLALSFPVKVSRDGKKHSLISPLSDEARQDIEQQVFIALHLDTRRMP